MSKLLRLRSMALPAVLAIAGAGLVGCGEDGTPGVECEGELGAKVEAFKVAVNGLIELSADMKAELAVACYEIANDLGATVQDPGDGSSVTDQQLQTLCNAASTAVDAAVTAQVGVRIEGGQCRVNAQAQVSCEADCSLDASCQGGDISARCTPGELSVVCSGECQANATCQGSANVQANCEGTCNATCTGTCSGTCKGTCSGTCSAQDAQGNCVGTCSGTCTGSCSARCEGTCNGDCKLAADANIQCGANARCKGECSGTATAPECEVQLTEPSCEVDAECQAACKSSASIQARCEPLKVTVTGDAELKATLEANLPKVVAVLRKGRLVVQAAGDIGTAAGGLVTEIKGSAQCAASAGTALLGRLEAVGSAFVSVDVSVKACASVSGSATGTSG